MKYDVNGVSEIEVLSTTEEKEITLSADSKALIFQMFSKNIYSNPIGSVVREITSNCFDSHIEAKVNAPVVIRKHKDNQTGTISISFIDFGVGISPDRMNNIFSVMFSSTKRGNNEQMGCFGLGSKVPLSYKRLTGFGMAEYDNSYYVITVFNGIKYVYQIYEKNNVPMYSEVHSEATTEKNGTEVQIPVLEKDVETFAKEMVRQLYYFENIVFEGFEDTIQNTNLTNDYQIIRGKSFLFRGDKYSSYIHVCLGRVAYTIDYNTLGLDSSDYQLPIALKLEVGDVNVTVSRENIDYSEATIKMLKQRLEIAKAEIVALISKQYEGIVTLEQYFAVKYDFGKLMFSNGTSLYVGNLIKQKDVDFSNFKYSFMKMPNDRQLFQFFFNAVMYGKKPKRSRYGSNSSFEGGYESLKSSRNLLYFEGEFSRKIVKQAYLKEEYETYYIINKRSIGNYMRAEIADIFNVHLDTTIGDDGKPVAYVQSLLDLQEEYMAMVRKYAQDYNTLEVPADFVASRKRGSGITPELRKQTIPVKFIGGTKDRVKLSTLFDYNMPIFYGTSEDDYALSNAVNLYRHLFDEETLVSSVDYNDNLQTRVYRSRNDKNNKKSIAFIQIAVGNVKYMELCKNANHISTFFHKLLYRKEAKVLQYFQTYALLEKYNQIKDFYTKGFVDKLSTKWANRINAVKKFIETIPADVKQSDLRYQKSLLATFFKLNEIKQTKEQVLVMKKIETILELQEKNEKTLSFFNLPYNADYLTDEQITILATCLAL